MTEDDLLELDLASVPAADAPLIGARAALGAAAGLGIASIAAAVWARLELESWSSETASRKARIGIAVAFMGSAAIGAFIGARKGSKMAAFVGASLGVAISQIPLMIDPTIVVKQPIVGNLWKFGVPIAVTVLAVNAVKAPP